MTTEHTPGPWRFQHFHVWAVDCGTLAADGYNDCCIVDRVDGRTDDEAEANARLIASAPELLLASKRLLTSPILIGNSPEAEDAYRMMQDAIAKAEGETTIADERKRMERVARAVRQRERMKP